MITATHAWVYHKDCCCQKCEGVRKIAADREKFLFPETREAIHNAIALDPDLNSAEAKEEYWPPLNEAKKDPPFSIAAMRDSVGRVADALTRISGEVSSARYQLIELRQEITAMEHEIGEKF